MRIVDEAGLSAQLMVYVWNKKVNWPAPDSAEDNRYFDHVVRRYQAFPGLVWNISKEALDYGQVGPDYISGRIDRIRKLDGHRRMVTVHDYHFCKSHPDLVDFVAIQEWRPDLLGAMDAVAAAHPGKPVLNIEHGGYEKTTFTIFDGAYSDAGTCLDRAYQCVFAGVYPTYYWQHTAWYHVVWDMAAQPENERPDFSPYGHLASLAREFGFQNLRPFRQSFAPPGLTDWAGLHLFYCAGNRNGIFGNAKALAGKRVSVGWFDPLTGVTHDAGVSEMNEGGWLGQKRDPRITGHSAVAILRAVETEDPGK